VVARDLSTSLLFSPLTGPATSAVPMTREQVPCAAGARRFLRQATLLRSRGKIVLSFAAALDQMK
jgi:hypothetical protein